MCPLVDMGIFVDVCTLHSLIEHGSGRVLSNRDLRTHVRVLCVLARVACVPCFLCLALECVVVRVMLCGASSVVITVTRTVEVQN